MTFIYKVQINGILITSSPQLVILPAIHLKNKIDPNYVPVMFVNLSNDQVQLTEHTSIGSVQFYAKLKNKQNVPVKETN